MGMLNITLSKVKDLKGTLETMSNASEKVVQSTIKDFKHRAPSWIAEEVAKEYGIKKKEIKPSKSGAAGAKNAGTINVKGKTVAKTAIVYKGRVLTPTHFNMTPKAPKQSYSLKAEIKKGGKKTMGKVKKLTKKQRKNIGRNFTGQGTKTSQKSPVMLMGTGNTKAGGTDHIPFQRMSGNRKDIRAVKTVSLPQMVSNSKVEREIYKAIGDKLGKRLDHYIDRYMGK